MVVEGRRSEATVLHLAKLTCRIELMLLLEKDRTDKGIDRAIDGEMQKHEMVLFDRWWVEKYDDDDAAVQGYHSTASDRHCVSVGCAPYEPSFVLVDYWDDDCHDEMNKLVRIESRMAKTPEVVRDVHNTV